MKNRFFYLFIGYTFSIHYSITNIYKHYKKRPLINGLLTLLLCINNLFN